MSSYFLLGWVVLITHFLEGITGFGCTVLALPFAILLVGTKQAVPVLLPCLNRAVDATVVAVGTVYGPPAALRDDPAALASAGQVCDLVLRLDLDQEQGAIALPGSAAHVAL